MGNLTVNTSAIADNVSFNGGGIYHNGGSATLTNNTITLNLANQDFDFPYGGGGLMVDNQGQTPPLTIKLNHTIIAGNTLRRLGVVTDSDIQLWGGISEGVFLGTADGQSGSQILLGIERAASHDAFDKIAEQSFAVTAIDDESAEIIGVHTDGSTRVLESGTSDTFAVRVSHAPSTDVKLTPTASDKTRFTGAEFTPEPENFGSSG